MKPAYVPCPGEILFDELAARPEMSIMKFSVLMYMSYSELWELVAGRAPVTDKIAWKLSSIFGTSEEFWINAQKNYDEWSKK